MNVDKDPDYYQSVIDCTLDYVQPFHDIHFIILITDKQTEIQAQMKTLSEVLTHSSSYTG